METETASAATPLLLQLCHFDTGEQIAQARVCKEDTERGRIDCNHWVLSLPFENEKSQEDEENEKSSRQDAGSKQWALWKTTSWCSFFQQEILGR